MGVRVISIIHYVALASLSAFHLRKHNEFKLRARIIGTGFFIIFIIMFVDWIWSFAQHLKWRSYIPPTDETAWLIFQPTPFGTSLNHDWHRWILYVFGFFVATDFLKMFFHNNTMTFNRNVAISLIIYSGFWIGLVFLSPNPLYCDVGLWNLWPKLALQTGEPVHLQTYFLADIVSRFGLILPFANSWFKK